jgi:HD-GYP domain-containing protein (c-di-GMP phosphodiesterase class II)
MWRRTIPLWGLLGVGAGAVLLWAGSRFSSHLVSVGLLVTSGAVAAMIARWRNMNGSASPREDVHQYEEMKRDLDASSRYLIRELQHTTATLRRKTFDMHSLFTITGEMSVITDLDALLNGFLLTLMGRVGCYAVLLYLKRSDDADEFSLQCWKGIDGDEAQSLSSIPVGSELVKALKTAADPLIIREDSAQERLRSELREFSQFEVAAPLLSRREVTGISFLGEKADGKHFSEMDLELISILSHQVSAAIDNAKLLEKTRLFYNSSIRALIAAVEARDAYTRGHAERTSKYAVAVAREMGYGQEEIENLSLGVLVHDIGKIAMSESLLTNASSPLEEKLRDEVKTHPKIGATILEQVDTLKWAIPLVLQHHERYDGTGYPNGLSGNEISLDARVLAIADSFDAMTSDRSYRKAMLREDALEELRKNAGTQFDPKIVQIAIPVLQTEIDKVYGDTSVYSAVDAGHGEQKESS